MSLCDNTCVTKTAASMEADFGQLDRSTMAFWRSSILAVPGYTAKTTHLAWHATSGAAIKPHRIMDNAELGRAGQEAVSLPAIR